MGSARVVPGPGQESVWDYPRPPRLEASDRHVCVELDGVRLADSRAALRVLETSHPPVYYLPPTDVRMDLLRPSARRSFCEWKGEAIYYDALVEGRTVSDAAWSYLHPVARFAGLADHIAFYPGKMDACILDGERVQPQPGDFYGGWITSHVVGPFKGGPGSWGW